MLDIFQFLAAADAVQGAADPEASGIMILFDNFGINAKIILAQAINFIVVAFLLWKLAFKPVMATIDERRRKIADGLQYAEEAKAQLAETEKKQAETLREANIEAQKVLEEAKEKAKVYYDKQLEETSAKVEDMLNRAREANELERKKMLSDVRQEIARLVVLTSGKVLKTELSEQDKKRFNESAARTIAQEN